MAGNNKVVWTEGMFLRPQHFQQHDRFFESLVHGRCFGLTPYDWGIYSLKIDQSQLATGKIAILECKGIFQDGTPFDLPEDNPVPLPVDVPEDVKDSVVYLSIPVRRPGSVETDSEQYTDPMARYHASEKEVRDNNMGSEGQPVLHVGQLRSRLMLERQERSGHLCLGIAKVIASRADKTIVLDNAYLSPTLNCLANPVLSGFIKELHGLLLTRAEALAGRVAQAGRGGVAEVADFLLLQVVNRSVPLFEHLSNLAGFHAEMFYREALQLAGELATFTQPEKRSIAFPGYKHDDLQTTMQPLMEELRRSLSTVLEQNAISITLSKPKAGYYGARLPDLNLLDSAVFVLAACADVSPEQLRNGFPAQIKIGPVEKIQQLVQSALPGIRVVPLPVAPRQIPFHAGYSYFELSKQGDLWGSMKTSGGFAFHIGGEFPSLEMEFWAIKNG